MDLEGSYAVPFASVMKCRDWSYSVKTYISYYLYTYSLIDCNLLLDEWTRARQTWTFLSCAHSYYKWIRCEKYLIMAPHHVSAFQHAGWWNEILWCWLPNCISSHSCFILCTHSFVFCNSKLHTAQSLFFLVHLTVVQCFLHKKSPLSRWVLCTYMIR